MRTISQINRRIAGNQANSMSLKPKTLTEETMLAEWAEVQAAQKNPARFRPLYERYYDPIFRFIFKRTGEEALCADICSQVFLKALQKLSTYTYKGVPFSAWLYRIASNEVAQHYRNSGKRRVVSIEENQLGEMMEEVDVRVDENQLQLMLEVLDDMPLESMQLIEMRYFEQRPFKEIAQILNITESNAKVKTYRILERMKKKMNKRKPSGF